MLESVLIIISFVFGLLCIQHLRRFDVHEPEPFLKMVAVTILGGLVSVALSLFLYRMLPSSIQTRYGIPFISYLYVGFVEELAKLAALFLCWPIIRNEMDEPTDGAIYMACVALGFSLIENYFYSAAHPSITFLIAIRLIICTPMHIAFSIFMGLAFFWVMRLKSGWGVLLGSYVVASIYHALFDTFASISVLLPGLYLILKSAYTWMYWLLGYTTTHSPFRQTLAEFIHSFPTPAIEPGFICLECNNAAPKPTYRRGRIRIQRCEECGTYLCSISTLRQLVHQYGSVFGSLKRQTKRIRDLKRCRVLIGGNRIDLRQHTACFQIDEFNHVLEKTSRERADKLEQKWWFPFKAEK